MYYDYENLCLENEIWKDVIDWEEFYQVSNFGRIKCKQREMFYDKNLGRGIEKKTVYEKIRKPKLNKHTGYLMVGLNGKGKSKNVTIHSMVAKSFIYNYIGEGIGKGLCTNHIDGNKLNNFVENLEVISMADNIRHAFSIGLSTSNHKIEYNGVLYNSKTSMRKELKISEFSQNKLIEDGLAIEIDNIKRIQAYNSMEIQYNGVTYESKKQMRKYLKISEKTQEKMILDENFKPKEKSIKIEFDGIVYESKRSVRNKYNLSEKKLNKMIKEGIAKII